MQKFYITGEITFKQQYLDSIAKSCIQIPTKSLWWSFFTKIVNFQLLTFFQRDSSFLCIVALCLFPICLLDKVLKWLFQIVFSIWETKKVVAGHVKQVGVLYSINCIGVCLGGLRIGCLRQVVVLQKWSFEQV